MKKAATPCCHQSYVDIDAALIVQAFPPGPRRNEVGRGKLSTTKLWVGSPMNGELENFPGFASMGSAWHRNSFDHPSFAKLRDAHDFDIINKTGPSQADVSGGRQKRLRIVIVGVSMPPHTCRMGHLTPGFPVATQGGFMFPHHSKKTRATWWDESMTGVAVRRLGETKLGG